MSAEKVNFDFVELHQIVSEQLGAGWGRAVVRAEVQDGAGAIDFYVIASDGDVFHKTTPPSLTSKIFDWVYALPARETGALMDWSVFVAQLTEHQSTNASFLIESNLEVSNFSQRRQRFEEAQFRGRNVQYDPL
jgi:hypothetical protein